MLKRYKDYINLKNKYQDTWGSLGNWKKGEIQIIEDVSLFPECEKSASKLMAKKGVSKKDADKRALVGIRDENRWGLVVCEPVKTPSGNLGTFVRFIPWPQLKEGLTGVVIVPRLKNGKYILLKTFRNATRSWCLEFPRGTMEIGEKVINTIKEELSLEAGAEIQSDIRKIGVIEPDSGILHSKVDVYQAEVVINKEISTETMEAISGLVVLDSMQIKKLVKNQTYKDKDRKTYKFNDSFSLSALILLQS